MWNILGNYPDISLVMVGDEAQLYPILLSDEKINVFRRPLRLSLFQRLKVLGQPSVLLNQQFRMVDSIETMVSKLFYSNLLSNTPSTAIQFRPRSLGITDYLTSVYSAKSPVILLAVSGTKIQDANKFRFDPEKTSVALNLGLDMVSRGVIKPRDLLIMTSYRAQFRLYWQLIRRLAKVEPRMIDIQRRTVDSMQGARRSVSSLTLLQPAVLVSCGSETG